MPLDTMSFGIDAIAARSQGATDLSPALLGSLLSKSRITSLLFAILLARREAAAAAASSPSASLGTVPSGTVDVPDVIKAGHESDSAWHALASQGFAVRAVSSKTLRPLTLKKAHKVDKQSPPGGTPVAPGTTVTLYLADS